HQLEVSSDYRSPWWLRRGLLAAVAVCILVPVTYKIIPVLIQDIIHTYRRDVPFFEDLSRPADFSLNHTVNMYLTSEEGISLGVWHTVPESRWKETQGKDLLWYQNTLNDGNPVFIYLHGNTGSSALGYHVVVPDYRGFGDSAGEPTESGLTTDALHVYNWVKARSGDSLVVIWGHSLGSGSILLARRYRQKCALVAAKAQSKDRVKLVTFDGSLGYLHNGLYRDPKLPGVLK
uniref:AB hydrolase-1 domain-containing protein n=1 Tax=Xiphophorus maculatus TaxID=8083 RepID=A0A3B5QTM2_XIPMA